MWYLIYTVYRYCTSDPEVVWQNHRLFQSIPISAKANQRHQCPMALGLCLLEAEMAREQKKSDGPCTPTNHVKVGDLKISWFFLRVFVVFAPKWTVQFLGMLLYRSSFIRRCPKKSTHTSFWGWNVQASPVGSPKLMAYKYTQMLLISLALGGLLWGKPRIFTVHFWSEVRSGSGTNVASSVWL